LKYIIGIDLGTSGVKCVLVSEEGGIAGSKSVSYTPDFGKNGYVEQAPVIWWNATKECIKGLIAANASAKDDIVALACSGQMHSSVFLDDAGEVIRPAILWNDTRTTVQTKEIYEKCGGLQGVLKEVYNLALEGFTLPKILWLKENEPDNYAKVNKVIMPKDYINYMLTGNIMTDYSDAAGTLMFDVKNRKFNEDFVKKAGVDIKILPKAVESTAEVGTVKADIAGELGLTGDVAVIAGGADNSCAAIGNGIVGFGDTVISVGTSGTVVAFLNEITSEVTGNVHLFNYSYPGSIYAMGCMLCAGESFNWLSKNILTDLSMDELNALAAKAPIGSNKLLFLPYLFGERCPHTDANARGMFFGISSLTGKGEMARAVMEGVAFAFKDMFDLVLGFAEMNEIYITGGGAKSELWGRIISNVINRELKVLNVEEGPAFGAALIAGVGAGVFESFKSAKDKTMKVVKTYTPNPAEASEYEKFYRVFKGLYAANKEHFAALAGIE